MINEEKLFKLLPYFFDRPSAVLLEIAQNAHRSGACRLAITLKGAILEVEDDGPGIASIERTKVFDRFYRAPGSPQGGSGLGLSIVRDICTSHGAEIELSTPVAGSGLLARVSFAAASPT